MQINGPENVQGPGPIWPHRIGNPRFEPAASETRSPDSAEISEVAKLKALLRDVPDVRFEKIERLRAEIAAGTYETPEKIQRVIDRVLEELS